MPSKKPPLISACAGAVALCLWAWVPSALSEPLSLTGEQARYLPIQSINYDFGSKSMSGYFVERSVNCFVTLMIIEKSDPEEPLAQSATRVRLVLSPGQVAGLDSEEGRSLNFTCADDAATLLVDVGDREKLVDSQRLALRKAIAQAPTPVTDGAD